jgi:hypothetical protein
MGVHVVSRVSITITVVSSKCMRASQKIRCVTAAEQSWLDDDAWSTVRRVRNGVQLVEGALPLTAEAAKLAEVQETCCPRESDR